MCVCVCVCVCVCYKFALPLFCSQFLYEFSHPNKYGVPQINLSDDNEASVDLPAQLSLSSDQLAIERFIVKVFVRYRCDVIITDRLRNLFRSKLCRMGKTLQSRCGPARTKLIGKWKETTWTIELKGNEIVPSRKRKSEHVVLQSSRNKQVKLEEKLKETTQNLKDITNQFQLLEESNKRLSVALKEKGESKHTSRRKKPWANCSAQYQRKRRREIVRDVKTALSFTENEKFTPTRVELTHKDTGEVLSVGPDGSTKIEKRANSKPSSDDQVDKTLYVKDKFNISNHTYHELAMINKELPRTSVLTKRARELDSESSIFPTPGKLVGVGDAMQQLFPP